MQNNPDLIRFFAFIILGFFIAGSLSLKFEGHSARTSEPHKTESASHFEHQDPVAFSTATTTFEPTFSTSEIIAENGKNTLPEVMVTAIRME